MEKATPAIDHWQQRTLAEKTVKSLKKNQFDARYCPRAEDAVQTILAMAGRGTRVGFGGSMTIVELGLVDKLEEKGARLLNKESVRAKPLGLDPESFLPMVRKLFSADLYLASANAITLGGEILNVDGAGNRVATITIGPKKVVLVAGINKIARTIEEAYARLEMSAGPKNSKRYKMANPCEKAGVCMDCQGATRICRIYHHMKFKPILTDMTILIVGESLGY